ncbi:hypothetical protein [Methylobacterium soli]|uniref:Uncharacterized protein n=1 Tax=Methylobacterium soli TaxID=553447 RepID=A0A6L3SWI4_9HYPH|nr:hypothetical protein [Methylobacterium soli]KAB1076516.1 hypothetical protein F6X53_22690 [Methylobacterium soli]GJE44847.1 hypothetical protein AEGHOMDF_4038 [Methylobacterium soli]
MRLLPAPSRLWAAFTNTSAVCVLAAGFALALSYGTAGTGAVIAVDGPPQNKAFEYRGPDKVRTLRVPLGGKVEYDLPWRIVEGGCDRWIVRTWTRYGEGMDAFTLTQRIKRPPYPIGKPGFDHIAADMPPGVTPGLWHYRAVGETKCATRTPAPFLFAAFDVEVFDPDGPVVAPLSDPILAQSVVPRGGPLAYRLSYERLEAAPSEVLNTFTALTPQPIGIPDIVFERRPTTGRGVGKHESIDISMTLPSGVRAGRWRMSQVIITARPGGRSRVDPQFSIEFEVVE